MSNALVILLPHTVPENSGDFEFSFSKPLLNLSTAGKSPANFHCSLHFTEHLNKKCTPRAVPRTGRQIEGNITTHNHG